MNFSILSVRSILQPRTIYMFSLKFLKLVPLRIRTGFGLADIKAIVAEFRIREISLSSHPKIINKFK